MSFLSKIIEKVISTQLVSYIVENGLTDDFLFAYKCGYSTETALLRVYNDIVVIIGKGNGNFLVLLDLSSTFDTIDHSNLFTVLGKHVGICDDALNLIVSYLSERKQHHIYADDTQLYISFKCNDPLATLPKLNSCISEIRVWMIKNKLKINDTKTKFIFFKSPQAKQDFK